jgi:2-iminobutanoate/2-iminopropanoate deaminase
VNREAIATQAAPAAVGPYSQAIKHAGMVFASGQLGLDPATGKLREGVEAQAQQVLANLKAVLAAAGAEMGDVVKTTMFLANMSDFAAVNAIYATAFPAPPPARSTIQVAALPLGGLVEIEAIAVLKG